MALLPKPEQVVSAGGNVAQKLLYGGLADLRSMPRTLIDDGLLREVYHYRPDAGVPPKGDPVLLVTPLAAPSSCFDLRRGCSLVEHFVSMGRPTYLVEYGQVSFADRNLGMEHWISEVVPEAIREVSAHADNRPVHVIGWSLGGIFATLTLANDTTLPVGSLTVVGSPFDLSKVPLIAPFRPLLNLNLPPQLRAVTRGYQALGGAPQPLVRWAFQLSAFQKLVTKPLALLQNLDNADFLAQIEAVDAFTRNMIAYPGRSFGQLYHRMYRGNQLLTGSFELDTDEGTKQIHLSDITVPTLLFGGATDGIAPVAAVKPLVHLLSGSQEVQFEVVPGGHLGMLTGRAARETTWTVMDEWIDRWSTKPRSTASAPKPSGKARADQIGSNRTRRYGSGASRAFG